MASDGLVWDLRSRSETAPHPCSLLATRFRVVQERKLLNSAIHGSCGPRSPPHTQHLFTLERVHFGVSVQILEESVKFLRCSAQSAEKPDRDGKIEEPKGEAVSGPGQGSRIRGTVQGKGYTFCAPPRVSSGGRRWRRFRGRPCLPR